MLVCVIIEDIKMSKNIKGDIKVRKGVIQDIKMILNSYILVEDRRGKKKRIVIVSKILK